MTNEEYDKWLHDQSSMSGDKKAFGSLAATEGDTAFANPAPDAASHAAPTPGPWSVAEGFGEFEVNGPSGAFLAAVATEANAHLIAAAPEMYEALKGFVGLLKSTGPRLLSAYTELLADAEAAIAKAEGK